MTLAWRDAYSIGIPEIDDQHRLLIGRIDDLERAVHNAAGTADLKKKLACLGKLLLTHFGTEEKLMVLYGYPDREAHMSDHAAVMRTFVDLMGEFIDSGSTSSLALALSGSVADWLASHLLGADQALGAFLNLRGPR